MNYKAFDKIHYIRESQRKWHGVDHPFFECMYVQNKVVANKKTCKGKVAGIIGSMDPNKQVHVSIERALIEGFEKEKIYEVLNSLKEKGWLKISESRPFKYIPVPPNEAMLVEKMRFEDKYQNWETIISDELQPLYENRQLVEHPEMLILRGQEAVMTKLEEILKKASKELMIAAPIFARNIISSIDPIILNLQNLPYLNYQYLFEQREHQFFL